MGLHVFPRPLLRQPLVWVLWVGVFCAVVCQVGLAQTITVSNLLDPSAPLVREGLVLVEGENFTDEEERAFTSDVKILAGVSVKLDGVEQVMRFASAQRVEFVADTPGAAERLLELTTKTGSIFRSLVKLVNVWPSVFLRSRTNDEDGYLVSGVWTIDQFSFLSITSEPIVVGRSNRPTLVVLQGSGWRYAPHLRVRLNGIPCQLLSAGPSIFPGQDELVFAVPPVLAGRGSFDVAVVAGGQVSNYSRIVLGNLP